MKTRFHIVLMCLGLMLTGWLVWTNFSLSGGGKNTTPEIEKPKMVHVGGEVSRPGGMTYKDDVTFYSIISAAGGPTQYGDLKHVRIYREGKLFKLDLTNDKLKNSECARPGDVIEVPQFEPVS